MLTTIRQPLEAISEKDCATVRWSAWQLIAFRFAFAYFLIYEPLLWLRFIPFDTKFIRDGYEQASHKLIPWIGANVLHLHKPITIFPNGSGDTTFNYVQVLSYLAIASAVTLLWSILDRRRADYARLHQWLCLFVRFSLMIPMFGYGAAKVFEGQFGTPCLTRLLQPYGDSTPMGLLWTMMGTSRLYCMFGGLSEVLGGLLLLVPRFTTLGALVCAGVMLNVFMLNMSYDVPVKLYSFHLLVMALFLLLPDVNRLAKIFILNRATVPSQSLPLTNHQWLNKALLVLPVVFGLYVCYTTLEGTYKYSAKASERLEKIPFYGIWQVDDFVLEGQHEPLLVTESSIWNKIVFDVYDSLSILGTNGESNWYFIKVEPKKKSIAVTTVPGVDESKSVGELSYDDSKPGKLILDGVIENKKIRAELHPVKQEFRLLTRGFHWINERPYAK